MSLEAQLHKEAGTIDFTATVALSAGQVMQCPDGRAAVVAGLKGFAIGDTATVYTTGIYTVAKTASMVVLDGQKLYWDATNSAAKYTGDFYIGTAVGDGTSAATTIKVDLNAVQVPRISLDQGTWSEVTSTATISHKSANEKQLALTTAGSAQYAWLTSDATVDIDDGPILEGWIGVFDNGDNAVVDIDWGFVSAAGTTDFEAASALAAFHLDGNDTDLDVHSDDGTTDTDPVDSTADLTEDVYDFYQLDLRTKTAPKFYRNGVLLTSTACVMTAYTSTLMAAVVIEKSGTDDTPGEVRVKELNVRTGRVA